MSKSINVLHVISSMDPRSGGPVEGIHNAIPSLKTRGVHSEVVCLDEKVPSYDFKDTFPVHRIGRGKSIWHYNTKLLHWLRSNVFRFDIIIVHGLWLFHGFAVYRIIKELRKAGEGLVPRYFIFPHGMLDPWFQQAPARRLKALRNWVYWKMIEGKIIKYADGVIFTNEEERKLAAKTFNSYLPNAEMVLGYGIQDPPSCSPEEITRFRNRMAIPVNRSYFLFMGRIHEKKGLDILVRAYRDLRKKEVHLPELVIAGPGLEGPYGRSLLKLTERSKAIHYAGFLTGPEKWAAVYGCEAFILPSHQENFGIAVVEALACGRPVLISDKINIWEEIEECDCGLVGTDTIDGTTRMVSQWMNYTSGRREAMGANAIECFRKYFTVERASQQFLEKLNQV